MTDETRWFWQQNVNYVNEIGGAIHDHVRRVSPVTQALEPFKKRIGCALESLRVLQRHADQDFRHDGMTLLRTMYDAHLQALYILADPSHAKERAQLFLDYQWIEQRLMQKLLEGNSTDLAQALLKSPRRAEGEAAREENYQRLRPKYLTRKGNDVRRNWYPGSLRDLAAEVELESEYKLLQRDLSGAVHSSPTALLVGSTFSDPEHLLLVGWRIMLRVLGRIAQHHAVPLEEEHEEIVRDSLRNLFDSPDGIGGDPP